MRKLVGRSFGKLQGEGIHPGAVRRRSQASPQQYVSRLERGRRNPTVVTLFHLPNALGVSHVDLVQPDDDARGERMKLPK
jgi:transcriptional regulator with XRE-family HTH domain